MNLPVIYGVLMVICIYNVSKGVAQQRYTCGSNMAAVCPGTYVVCSCTISDTNSQYNQWNISYGLCETVIDGPIQLNRTGKQCSNNNQHCGQFIRAWNEPSYNSTELNVCETSTILIRASHDLDGLAFECQDGTTDSNGTPTSYGRTVLSVISAPENPRITNVDSDNPTVLAIEWFPAENGSRPNSFNVTISKYGVSDPLSSASVVFEDGRSLPYSYTFTGLTSGTDYDISVVAINCAGISTVYQSGVKTDDGFKEGIMYAGIFLGGFIIIAVLCAVILYKYKKWTNAVPNTTPESQTNAATTVSIDIEAEEHLTGETTQLIRSSEHLQPYGAQTETVGHNPPVPSSEGHISIAPYAEGHNPPATSAEDQNPPAPYSVGQNPLVPYSENQNPPAQSSEGQNPRAPSSEGRGPPISLKQLRSLSWTDDVGQQHKIDVVMRASGKYKMLGMWLLKDDNADFVKILEHTHKQEPQQITEEIFCKWINERTTPVNWPALIGVFRDIELNALAHDIVEAFFWRNAPMRTHKSAGGVVMRQRTKKALL